MNRIFDLVAGTEQLDLKPASPIRAVPDEELPD
jgi:hypothetical protein